MKPAITILILLFAAVCRAQQASDSSSLIQTYTGDIASVAVDNLDNVYIISSTGQIKKLNANGDSAGVYNQAKNYGRLYSADVSNPLKILLFYKDFSTVVILDRLLATQSTMDLKRFSILGASAVGNSYDNNIWVFDAYDNKLKKIDEQGNQLLATPDFRSIFDEAIAPQKIISDNGLVYLADSSHGVFVFDNYGSFKRKIPVKSWDAIAIINGNLISIQQNRLIVFNTTTQIETEKNPPFFQPYLHTLITPTRLINFSTDTARVYRYRF